VDFRSLSPEDLVAACLATREEAVWAEFVRRFRPLISTVVLRTARNWGAPTPTQLDDLIQETYLKLCADDCRLLKNFRSQHPGAIFGFLKVVTANVVNDYFKAFHAVKRGSGTSSSLSDPERNEYYVPNNAPEAGLSVVEQAVLLQEIDRCLARLVSAHELPRSRRIFWLYYRCGFSARAIASLPSIELTTKGVESTILRLNRLVRTAVGPSAAPKATQNTDSKVEKKGVRRAGSL
jgi:RNA polymerase sigma-70 factor, ECF subfamily